MNPTLAASSTPSDAALTGQQQNLTANSRPSGTRLVSLDALRGFDMFWIVGGAILSEALFKMKPNAVTTLLATQLEHVPWEGFHFYDLIFPLFLFIVGVSIVLSLGRHRADANKAPVVKRILRRTVLLYLLGLFYHGGFSELWPNIQFSGVLQRIAACYFFSALIFLFCPARVMAILSIGLLGGYWGLLTFVPFPDLRLTPENVERLSTAAGSHSPAAIAAAMPGRIRGVYEEGRNLTNYLDFRFLPGRKPIGQYYINEGLLSTLPAITISLAGVFAGLLLTGMVDERRKVTWLFASGVAAAAIGLLWSLQFPFVKRIWTSSFCLTATGCSAMLLAVFYLIVDVWQTRRWCQPFIWIGTNAIALYLTANVMSFGRIAGRLAGGDVKAWLDTRVASGFGALVVALVSLGLVVALARFLYQRKIFLRV
jgi:predicted acyltransferase